MDYVTISAPERELLRRFNLHIDLDESDWGTVYFSENSDLSVLDYLRFRIDLVLWPVRVSRNQLLVKINNDVVAENRFKDPRASAKKNESPPSSDSRIVKEINSIITESIKSRASDIHFEPSEKNLIVRIRIDGVLFTMKELSFNDLPEITSRIKIMSGLDIAEKRRPQDGRIRFNLDDRLVDIRVSIIPADFGEKAVLRILDKDQLRLKLSSLGFIDDQLEIFKKNISTTSGIVLVTGPTGSGKTTTLYAALNYLKSGNVNISTVEDPIEYNLEGINQTQVKPDINLTFAAMLRALLRQDPNIIMVGEIRDKETLEIAIRASQTGHLVLSTVHTNNSISTVTRLLDLGTEPFLLSSSLKMIVAQRLFRKICSHCRAEVTSESEKAAATTLGILEKSKLMAGQGCDKCNKSGYRGRSAIYEILPINDELRAIIHDRGSESELLNCASLNSFKSMKEQAVELIQRGLTTASEVRRELGI